MFRPFSLVRYVLGWAWSLVVSGSGCILALFTGPSRAWLIVTKFWARGTLKILGINLQLEGAEHLTTPAIYISNHQSLLDVICLPAVLPRRVRFIAKRELLFIPCWGWFFAAGGAVLINRKKSRSAIESIKHGLKRLPENWSLAVFPEGTRSRNGAMRPFKRGAFHIAAITGIPIIPVGIDGARDVAPLNRLLISPGDIRITFGPPIDTSTWSVDDLRDHVRTGEAAVRECVRRAAARRMEQAQDAPSMAWEALDGG